jgi:nitrogen fixation protein FixH
MSWGNKLLLVFIAFTGLMSYMTYRCVTTPVELVANEYYHDELAYQNVIDGAINANALSRKVNIRQEAGKIMVEFPPEMTSSHLTGTILFYNAANLSRDRNVRLNVLSGGKIILESSLLGPGQFTVKITWNANNKDYYSEQNIMVI